MTQIKTDISAFVTIYSRCKDTFSLSITVKNADGSNFDFTGYSAIMNWWKNASNSTPSVSISSSVDNEIVLTSGLIKIKRDASDMDIPSGSYKFILQLTDSSSNTLTWLNGIIQLNKPGVGPESSDSTLQLTINESGDTISITIEDRTGTLIPIDQGSNDNDFPVWSAALGKFAKKTIDEVKTLLAIDTKYDKVADLNLMLKAWVESESFQVLTATRDADENITSANVKWPDGSLGIFTAANYNAEHFVYDSYTITHTNSGKTVSQASVTRNTDGCITIKPELTIAG